MGIPAIGVVAVLVASVAFTAWIQAPGMQCLWLADCMHIALHVIMPFSQGCMLPSGVLQGHQRSVLCTCICYLHNLW